MKVSELIEELQKMRPDLPVRVRESDYAEDEEFDVLRVFLGGTMGKMLPGDRVILYLRE